MYAVFEELCEFFCEYVVAGLYGLRQYFGKGYYRGKCLDAS